MTVTAKVPIQAVRDRLLESEPFEVKDNAFTCIVPAGGVRILEIKQP